MFISDECIKHVMSVNYNSIVVSINRLDGYEDLNFKLQIVDQNSDSTSGYETVILKILSPKVAKATAYLHHKMMLFLYENGINTCRPVQTVEGTRFCKLDVFSSPDKDAMIETAACVLTYIPGVTFRCADHPFALTEDVGRYAGKVDKLLQNFEQDNLQVVDTLWELTRAPEIESYLEKHCNADVRKLGKDILDAFQQDIKPALNSFQKGYIHGDMNDCNIIVSKSSPDAETYVISGLIDYGDASVSFYVYELATLMADLMSTGSDKRDPLDVGRLVLKGYRQEFELNKAELNCLRLVICVRMIQFYVLNTVTLEMNPDNEYAILGNNEYLDMCKVLWEMGDEKFKNDVIN